MDITRNTAFFDFICEDKTSYPSARSMGYIDPDDDFLVGKSGGFLMNMSFKFINTHLLSPAASIFDESTMSYVPYDVDSPEYLRFMHQEERRRKYGYTAPCKLLPDGTVEDLYITGHHYNFLNYGRMMRLKPSSGKGISADKEEGFPKFFDSQYWWYKVKRFCKLNGFNLPIAKSRRAGASYMEAIDSANDINLTPKITIGHTAYLKKYLTSGNSLTNMAKNQLIFYELYTPFNRNIKGKGLLKQSEEEIKVGYKTSGRTDAGFGGRILSYSTLDNPGVWVGKDAKDIKIDELNDIPNLFAMLGVTEPLTRTGSYKTGMITGLGTGGSKTGNWADFEAWFYKGSYSALRLENVWDKDRRHEVCGFYKPFWWGLEGTVDNALFTSLYNADKTSNKEIHQYYRTKYGKYIGQSAQDKDGNSNYEIAMAISDLERVTEKLLKSEDEYKIHCAMYSHSPSETFSSGGSNMFSSVELTTHKEYLSHASEAKTYQDGEYEYTASGSVVLATNSELITRGIDVHPFITDVPHNSNTDTRGCVREFYPPITDDLGFPIKDLYVITYDTVGVDKTRDELTDKHSLCSIQVWMPPNDIANNKCDLLMASWCGRTDSLEEDDVIFLKFLQRYSIESARGVVERDRGETISNFKKWGKLELLMKDPTHLFDGDIEEDEATRYGISMGNIQTKLRALKYAKELLYAPVTIGTDRTTLLLHYIKDLSFITELTRFNIKGNFDRLSSFLLYALARKALVIKEALVITGATRDSEEAVREVLEWLEERNNEL